MNNFKLFLLALTFLTRIPVPVTLEFDKEMPAKSSRYYPLIGLLIGLILVIIDKLLTIFFPLTIVNILLLIVLIYLSGGLHLDGFMDTIDGFF